AIARAHRLELPVDAEGGSAHARQRRNHAEKTKERQMIGHVTGDSREPAQAGGIATLDCPLGHESLEQPARRRQVTAEIVGDGETEPVRYRPSLRSRPALQPAYGPLTRRGRLRPVIVCRQLERGKQRDVGRRPPRLWRET